MCGICGGRFAPLPGSGAADVFVLPTRADSFPLSDEVLAVAAALPGRGAT